MKNLLKLKIIILIISIFFASKAVAADRILPIPKPTVDQEAKEKTAKTQHGRTGSSIEIKSCCDSQWATGVNNFHADQNS